MMFIEAFFIPVIMAFFVPPIMAFTIRTMGELAHPGADYAAHLKELTQIPDCKSKAQYLIENGFSTAALVGTLADGERRNERISEFKRENGRVLYHRGNRNRAGRSMGIGMQPQINYGTIAEAVIANSHTLTPRDLIDAKAKVEDEIDHGAWLYSPFQPRRTSTGLGIAGHVDAFFVPDGDSPTWWMTSLIDPTLTGSDIVIQRLKAAGFNTFQPMPPNTILEKLYSDIPPNSMVGNWNAILAGDMDEAGKNLTFARLASAQAGKPDQVIYETMIISKIWLPVELYRDARLIYELQEKAKAKPLASLLSIGTHSGINSCAQFTGALFDPMGDARCLNLQGVYLEAVERSAECFLTDKSGKEIFDFLQGSDEDFKKVSKFRAKVAFDTYLEQPTLMTSNRPDRATYYENYSACSIPHPDPVGVAFYDKAADIALDLLKKKD